MLVNNTHTRDYMATNASRTPPRYSQSTCMRALIRSLLYYGYPLRFSPPVPAVPLVAGHTVGLLARTDPGLSSLTHSIQDHVARLDKKLQFGYF